jgi:hypothetical protein
MLQSRFVSCSYRLEEVKFWKLGASLRTRPGHKIYLRFYTVIVVHVLYCIPVASIFVGA